MDHAIASGKRKNAKSLSALSREVVQTAEDAREIAVKHIDEERAGAERREGHDREASAKLEVLTGTGYCALRAFLGGSNEHDYQHSEGT